MLWTPELDAALTPPAKLLIDGTSSPDGFRRAGESFVRAYLVERMKLSPNERVLDLGSGNGSKARALVQHLNELGGYVGLDIDRAAIDWCQNAYSTLPNFEFVWADIKSSHYNPEGKYEASSYNLPFNDRSFDLIFLCSVFTHMTPDGITNYLNEISRVIRPEGRIMATVFLINDQSVDAMKKQQTSRVFQKVDETFYVLDKQNYAKGIAIDELWLRDRIMKAGLVLTEMQFGLWRHTTDLKIASHDAIFMRHS